MTTEQDSEPPLAGLTIPQSPSCSFCDYLRGAEDAVFVSRGKAASVLVNPRQYERGALLVIPNQHASTLIDTNDEPFLAVQLEARRMARLLVQRFGATGVNVFQNAGTPAGQTVPHYHVHVVPRYPSSDPAKRFREADYGVTPIEHLRTVAETLNEQRETSAQDSPLFEKYPRNPRLWWTLLVGWMTVAFASLTRLFTAPDSATDWPTTVPSSVLMAALFVGSMTTRAKNRRSLIAGYTVSIVLCAVSVLLTF